jgi:dTDP-4-amino-4,6-dideoxy-D-galactose acyltransferase
MLVDLRREGVRLAYARTPCGSRGETAAAKAGGQLVSRRVTYAADLHYENGAYWPPTFDIAPFGGPLTPALESLALASGAYSRFKIDPQIPQPVFDLLYRTWIRKSVTGELAERVFVARVQGIECGMVTVAKEGERGTIGLMAVAETERCRGIGRALVCCARRHHLAMNRQSIQVVTQQSNKPACTFYENVGFRVERIESEYHFWL